MNLYKVNYNISLDSSIKTDKTNKRYVLLSDLHGYFSSNLALEVSNIKCDYVIIAGDILNGRQWENDVKVSELIRFLGIISFSHPVIITMGNHDLNFLTAKGFKNFKELEIINNVYPLYNESIKINSDSFTNVMPNLKTYSYFKQDNERTVYDLANTFSRLRTKKEENVTNHLITHNPYHVNHKEVTNLIKDYDIIESGHFHDGFVPTKYIHDNLHFHKNKSIEEIFTRALRDGERDELYVKPKRDLSRGVTYIFDHGYYVLLPNNEIYYYDYFNNKYFLSTKRELDEMLYISKVPPVVITGAINSFMKLPIFYPYITTIDTNDNYVYSAKSKIKKI